MKFLLDAQLPKKLTDFLRWKGYDAIHTLDLEHKISTSSRYITYFNDKKRVQMQGRFLQD